MAINCDDRLGFHQCGLASAVRAYDAEFPVIAALWGCRVRGSTWPVAAKLLAELSGRCPIRADAEESRTKAGTKAKPKSEQNRDGRAVFHRRGYLFDLAMP